MSKKVQYVVINVNEFLKVKPTGEFDKEETGKALARFRKLIADSAGKQILLDGRDAFPTVPLTFTDIYEFVAELGKQSPTRRSKIAVLTREDYQFDNARFFELCAGNRGFEAAAFTSFEAAINWFSKTSDAKEL